MFGGVTDDAVVMAKLEQLEKVRTGLQSLA